MDLSNPPQNCIDLFRVRHTFRGFVGGLCIDDIHANHSVRRGGERDADRRAYIHDDFVSKY